MTHLDLAHLRLFHQRLTTTAFEKPGDVVEWLGAVQAQDYLGSLWAVGLRMRKAVESDIERGLADRTMIRTWPMRGTLHFVAAADARWMLRLLTPRILRGPAQRAHQQSGLDEATFARSQELLITALQHGKQLTRNAMYQVLEAGGISTADYRGLHILSRLAQDGLICFGVREGKQQTFVLLDEWVPVSRTLERDEALAELAARYFTSHGPATLQDFAWWSGLTAGDARAGLEMAKSQLIEETIDGQIYWLSSSMPTAKDRSPGAHLLPAYDEYTVAYKDRSAVLSSTHAKRDDSGHGIFNPTIVVNGRIVGTWKRTIKRDSLVISPNLFTKLGRTESRAVASAAGRYSEFLGAQLVMNQD